MCGVCGMGMYGLHCVGRVGVGVRLHVGGEDWVILVNKLYSLSGGVV